MPYHRQQLRATGAPETRRYTEGEASLMLRPADGCGRKPTNPHCGRRSTPPAWCEMLYQYGRLRRRDPRRWRLSDARTKVVYVERTPRLPREHPAGARPRPDAAPKEYSHRKTPNPARYIPRKANLLHRWGGQLPTSRFRNVTVRKPVTPVSRTSRLRTLHHQTARCSHLPASSVLGALVRG